MYRSEINRLKCRFAHMQITSAVIFYFDDRNILQVNFPSECDVRVFQCISIIFRDLGTNISCQMIYGERVIFVQARWQFGNTGNKEKKVETKLVRAVHFANTIGLRHYCPALHKYLIRLYFGRISDNTLCIPVSVATRM